MNFELPPIQFPELVFGLVAPIGTDLGPTLNAMQSFLERERYDVEVIKVTDLYEKFTSLIDPPIELKHTPLEDRYRSFIAFGNAVRAQTGDDGSLAMAVIEEIVRRRIAYEGESEHRYSRKAWLVSQFKRKEEIDLMRSVYGRLFFQVSVYSTKSARSDNLSRKIADSHSDGDVDAYKSIATELVRTDENERRVEHGQRVGKVFSDADFIVNADANQPQVGEQCDRFLELIFGNNKITPTKIEYGLFAAKSAALRTSDLSRQVGAAIFSKAGEVIALGSNEVPKAGGGTYWHGDVMDAREFVEGFDSNDQRKDQLLSEILEGLELSLEELEGEKAERVLDAAFMDALEYGRVVHAEMSAICDASRNYGRCRGSIMYVTTFPCHMCAKHIVASGISTVYFLEPYPKSLAQRLHSDSIRIERGDRGKYDEFDAVEFIHFSGVTPRRYREMFERGRRKDKKSRAEEYVGGNKRPNIDLKSPFYVQLEDTVLNGAEQMYVVSSKA